VGAEHRVYSGPSAPGVEDCVGLAGDQSVRWLLGQIDRDRPDPGEEHGLDFHRLGGYCYRHMIESGAMTLLEFESGLRVELFTGGMRVPPGRSASWLP
jgi:hypothetical protein